MATEWNHEEWLESALKTGDPEEKLEYCTKYLDANPKDSDAWEYKGSIAAALGNEDEQYECGKAGGALDGLHYNRGMVHLGENDSAAVRCFSAVLEEEDPSRVNAWVWKGEALKNLKRYQESIACVEKVVALNPRGIILASAWAVKGEALEGLGKLNEAVECYDRSLEIDVGNYRALSSKAFALFDSERYEESIVCLDQLLKKYPNPANPDRMNAIMDQKKRAEAKIQEKRSVEGKKQKGTEDRPSFCKKCGGSLLKDARFCTKCGSRIA